MSTIDYYNEHAAEFCNNTINVDMSYCRNEFLKYVKKNGLILDAGCGSGRDTIAFINAGYSVEAFDASEEICKCAEVNTGIPVRCLRFEDIDYLERFDGIWASASLLHVAKEDLQDVFIRLAHALKQDGILYASFKYGNHERIINGRYFNDPTDYDLELLVNQTKLQLIKSFVTFDARPERANEQWRNIIYRK